VRHVAGKPDRTYAIRVSGGEIEHAPATPAPIAAPARVAAAPEPVLPKPEPAASPEPPAATSAASTPAPEPSAPDSAAEKPQKPGHRFVRALGKINPFRKGSKDDAVDPSKVPVKKD
jgi:hypothetical protein